MRANLPVSGFGGGNDRPGSFFESLASKTSHLVGKPVSFLTATAVVIIWAVSGPLFHYSDTWQLVINTGTTIITFLMVFLIQATQNRDTQALHIKLDELIIATKGARNNLATIEDATEEEIDREKERVRARAEAES